MVSSLHIHDALALGEYEAAIPAADDGSAVTTTSREEVHRLPLLLRLLSASRPLASLPDLQDLVQVTHEEEEEDNTLPNHDDDDDEQQQQQQQPDKWLDSIVQRLEDRAALYSVAEGLEVLAGHLAPHVCKKWSKLAPPQCQNGVTYDTTALEQAARHATTTRRRRKLSETSLGASSTEEGNVLADYNRIDVYEEDDDDDDDDGADNEEAQANNMVVDDHSNKEPGDASTTTSLSDAARRKRRKQSSSQLLSSPPPGASPPTVVLRRHSTATVVAAEREFAAEDSQQALATKSWTELALLVTQSLQQPIISGTSRSSPPTCLTTMDEASILAQSQSSSASQSTGLISTDTSATLAAMLHHTPVLRYDHVATALCRVGLSQAADICARLGANAPATVPALVHGCAIVALSNRQGVTTTTTITTTTSEPTRTQDDDNPHATGSGGAETFTDGDNTTAPQVAIDTAMKSIQALAALSPHQAARIATQWRLMSPLSSSSVGASSPPPPSSVSRLALSLAVQQKNALTIALWVDQHLDLILSSSLSPESERCNAKKDTVIVQALTCLAEDIQISTRPGQGRLQWTLHAYVRLLACHKSSGPYIAFDWMETLLLLAESDSLSGTCASFHLTLVAIAWLGYAQCQASTAQQAKKNVSKCQEILIKLLHESSSRAVLNCYVVTSWKMEKSERLGRLILDGMAQPADGVSQEVAEWLATSNSLDKAAQKLVQGFDFDGICHKAMTESAVVDDLDSAAKCLADPQASSFFDEGSVRNALAGVLESYRVNTLLKQHGTLPFLDAANKFLSQLNMKERGLPLVLPLQLEKLALSAQDKLQQAASDMSLEVASLLLNLAYTLCFLQEQPECPFRADLRNLPLTEIYAALQSMDPSTINEKLRQHLLSGLPKACKELVVQSRLPIVLHQATQAPKSTSSADKLKKDVAKVIRDALKDPAVDPSGEMIEATFCRALGVVSQGALCCTVASAVLSVGFPLTVFPYRKLCMDPLTLLKCPLACWDRPGFRRVCLTVLSFLLRVNDTLCHSATQGHDETSEEFLVSRNVLLIRCMMALMHKCSALRSCPMTACFLRAAFSQCPGIGAVILRQGLSDDEIDWLISNVPEIMDDGNAYVDLLARFETIPSTSERLVAASGILRITIMHGHRLDTRSWALAYGTTNELIVNFFVVIGPVGVPVQAFVGEEKGTDATQICRRAALRMIKSMCHVRGQRESLRNACIMALNKLARLCKGEEIIGGLSSSLANRQKNFVREMLDSINKALISMGSGH